MKGNAFITVAVLVAAMPGCKVPAENDEQVVSIPAAGTAESTPAKAPPRMAEPPIEPDQIPAPADVSAPPENATRTASGLAYRVLEQGKGASHPGPTSRVTVHYTGWTTDGRMFDSSVQRGKPSTFPLDRVIAGWTEGLQLMVTGEKTRFWIPEELAYKGRPDRPQGMLVFEVELIEILD